MNITLEMLTCHLQIFGFWRYGFFWALTPCNFVYRCRYNDISEERAAFLFRAEESIVKIWRNILSVSMEAACQFQISNLHKELHVMYVVDETSICV
jgi:hypothetical protein